jgi:hypothetical protein
MLGRSGWRPTTLLPGECDRRFLHARVQRPADGDVAGRLGQSPIFYRIGRQLVDDKRVALLLDIEDVVPAG